MAAGEIAVTDESAAVMLFEMRCEPLGEVHRAMLAARAAYRHGQVAAVRPDERRQPACDEIAHVLEEPVHVRLLVEEARHVEVMRAAFNGTNLMETLDYFALLRSFVY